MKTKQHYRKIESLRRWQRIHDDASDSNVGQYAFTELKCIQVGIIYLLSWSVSPSLSNHSTSPTSSRVCVCVATEEPSLITLTSQFAQFVSFDFYFFSLFSLFSGENPAAMQHANSNRCSHAVGLIHLLSLITTMLYMRWLGVQTFVDHE